MSAGDPEGLAVERVVAMLDVAEVMAVGCGSSQSPSSPPDPGSVVAGLVVLVVVVPLPETPPDTPAATKRASASLNVSQARLVPAFVTRGRAKQLSPEEHA